MKKCILFLFCMASTLCALEYKESFVEVEGAKLYCREYGSGKPLIIIHGGPGLSQEYLLPYLEKLADHNRVIFYDQRASGKSTGEINSKTMRSALFAEDLEAVRKHFGLKKISLLGHSWGGHVAMQYAIGHSNSVDRLILANSMGHSSQEWANFIKIWMKKMAPFMHDIETIESTGAYKKGDPEAHEQLLRVMFSQYMHNPNEVNRLNLKMSPQACLHFDAINKAFQEGEFQETWDLQPALRTLSFPVLVIHGKDDILPEEMARHIHESIPRSQYLIMEQCGHFPYVEQPDQFFQAIQKFQEK